MPLNNKLGVVYLMWVPFGITYFASFIKSYTKHPAGVDHKLIICFNGVDNDEDLQAYLDELKSNNLDAEVIKLRQGQDIDSYIYVSKNLDIEYLLFFNTYSIIKDDNWLEKYFEAITTFNTGLVGSTASLQSYYSSVYQKHPWYWENEKGFGYNFRKYKLFIKAFVYWRFLFKPFPNPHIRTTGFMTRRLDFLAMNPGPVQNKFKAYLFENGRKSLTNYFLEKGQKVLLMDKHGKTYEPKDWSKSATFWIKDQENLLISDNQTTIYQEAGEAERKVMTKLAWGL